jgi:hypothetical protein
MLKNQRKDFSCETFMSEGTTQVHPGQGDGMAIYVFFWLPNISFPFHWLWFLDLCLGNLVLFLLCILSLPIRYPSLPSREQH